MSALNSIPDQESAVAVHNRTGRGAALIVCEHASNKIPAEWGDLGLSPNLLDSHIAWDPGALAVARHLSAAFDAPLVAGRLSRLLFDCNRPPSAADAIPTRSENYDIPGNRDLTADQRATRIRHIHDPFRDVLSAVLSGYSAPPVIITVHSFTPVFRGAARQVEIGLIHDNDDRMARVMLAQSAAHTKLRTALNDPYDPKDGVTHTLRAHALPIGALNIMLEIRNDLIADSLAQADIAAMLAGWISAACADLDHPLLHKATPCLQ